MEIPVTASIPIALHEMVEMIYCTRQTLACIGLAAG